MYSYRTTLCLQYDATHIAIAAIFLAAIKLDTKPLNRSKAKNQVERTWYELLETDIEEEALKSTYINCTYNFVCTLENDILAFLLGFIKINIQLNKFIPSFLLFMLISYLLLPISLPIRYLFSASRSS
jgi:hypothetical protein